MNLNIIPLDSDGQAQTDTQLGSLAVSLVTRYNYGAECWTLDILDASGTPVLVGLMIVPNTDILKPYLAVKQSYGSLVPIEQFADSYKDPEALGSTLQLLWYPPGNPVVLP